MNITVFPKKLSGQVTVPPSKSVAHRMVIAAALSNGVSEITNLYPSVDILATMDCMRALGAKIDFDGDKAVIEGIKDIPESAVLDCCESGSTLRFLIPVACALGVDTKFIGRGRLPQRPITPYLEEFPKHGVSFEYNNTMPFSTNGKLTGGKFYVDGGISSQFITGLLFALPLLEEDSEIILTSHLESKPYVDITLGTLREHGCQVEETENGYFVKGGQHYMPFSGRVEGDYSQAAFHLLPLFTTFNSRLLITYHSFPTKARKAPLAGALPFVQVFRPRHANTPSPTGYRGGSKGPSLFLIAVSPSLASGEARPLPARGNSRSVPLTISVAYRCFPRFFSLTRPLPLSCPRFFPLVKYNARISPL